MANAFGGKSIGRLRNRSKYFRILFRILHTHAAMAEGAYIFGKQYLVWSVVLIDEKFIRKIKADAA